LSGPSTFPPVLFHFPPVPHLLIPYPYHLISLLPVPVNPPLIPFEIIAAKINVGSTGTSGWGMKPSYPQCGSSERTTGRLLKVFDIVIRFEAEDKGMVVVVVQDVKF